MTAAAPSEHLAHANQQLRNRRGKPPSDAVLNARIRDISVKVYQKRLGAKATERMLADHNDGGTRMRGLAAHLDPVVRAVLEVIGVQP